jgi:hypothetical protein
MGKKVVLMYPTPEIGWNAKVKIKQNQINGVKADLTVSYELVKKRNGPVTDTFDKLKHENLTKIYSEKVFCSTETNRCRVQNGNTVYYSDTHHLDADNAVQLFSESLSEALKI